MSTRMCIARHNGIGDLVMLTPLIGLYHRLNYNLTVQCEGSNHGWLKWLYPNIRLVECEINPYEDFRLTHPDYDYFLNFNRMELQDDMARQFHVEPINWQYLAVVLAKLHRLPIPDDLSPSQWVPYRWDNIKTDKVYIFSKATSVVRSLGDRFVNQLMEKYPNAELNPRFKDKIELINAIGQAKLVIAGDTGPIHLAEMTRTRWICYHTSFSNGPRHRFYKYGHTEQAELPCSPCYTHGDCPLGHLECVNKFSLPLLEINDGK